jgi:hypothetical protein
MDGSNNPLGLGELVAAYNAARFRSDAADLGYNRQVGPLEKNDHVTKLSDSPAR